MGMYSIVQYLSSNAYILSEGLLRVFGTYVRHGTEAAEYCQKIRQGNGATTEIAHLYIFQ